MITKSHILKGTIFSVIALASVLSTAEVKLLKETIEEEKHNMLVDAIPATSSLRCWQYGELLFEEVNIHHNQTAKRSMQLVFETSSNDTQQQLYLINMGNATCLYKSTESKS